tara:strand:+ start:3132 stop:5711 length:2580 start_codon:yes stop_codon:yes gene_type:complete
MDNQLFRDIQTDLDLNGPILSFTTQPADVTINVGQTATFTATATVSFPGDPTPINSGTIGYQWYGPNGALTEGTKYVGTKTTTLQITNVTNPTDVGAYYVQVDYVPSTQTGNAVNEPLNSNNGNLISPPLIEIIAQPTPIETIQSRDSNFNIDATLSDNGTDIGFQWQLDGENVSDGTVTKSTVEEIPGTTERRVSVNTSLGNSQTVGIPAGARNVLFNVCGGAGGKGGGNFNNPGGPNRVGGRGGFGMEGWFRLGNNFYINNQEGQGLRNSIQVTLNSGRRGSDGVVGSTNSANGGSGSAGQGGNGGAHGYGRNGGSVSSGDAGGGGGGGGSASVIINGTTAIVAGGGGGGGGAFNNPPDGTARGSGSNGNDAGPVRTNSGYLNWNPATMSWTQGTPTSGNGGAGSNGHSGQGIDTPGGGGGGAGSPGGSGGHHGHRPSGSPGGIQGGSAFNPSLVTYRSGSFNMSGNGYASAYYIAGVEQTTEIVNVTRTTTISGSSTNQLTLNTDGPGIGYTVRCNVNSSIASNSPLISDEVGYQVESTVDTADIVVEGIGFNNSLANVSTTDLSNGELTLDTIGTGFVGPAPTIQLYSLYAPDKDVNIEMDLYGGGGATGTPEGDTGGNDGGEGGFARIRFTMKQNEEYVIAGLTDNVNTPFLYRGATLIACVGEGGKSFRGMGDGGDGGGVGVAGASGTGSGAGHGGPVERPGAGGINLRGEFGSAYSPGLVYNEDSGGGGPFATAGGKTISCTKGVYWRQQGVAPCADISGSSQFRLSDGTVVVNTGSILRGYKAGYNIIQTAGGGTAVGYRGGNGATGGSSGVTGGAAGGGGSGYTDGSVTIVTTTQGGSTGAAKVVIRVVT